MFYNQDNKKIAIGDNCKRFSQWYGGYTFVYHKRGVTLLWTAVVALVLFAIGAFAVDLGNLWLVRNELQNTADSAALAAASALGSGDFKQVYARARAWAAENTADGEAVNLNFEDIAVGRWDEDTRTFTKYDPFDASIGEKTPPNAVKVKACRDYSHTGPVKLAFGRLLGQDTAELSADAIAVGRPATISTAPTTPNSAEPATPDNVERGTPDASTPTSPTRGHFPEGFVEWPVQDILAWLAVNDPYVIYIMDTTDSMSAAMDEGTTLAQALLNWSETAVVGKLITKVGLVSFENDARMEQDLSDNVGAVYEGIDELHFGEVPEEKHSVAEALDMSLERLWNEPVGELEVEKVAYLFSDGKFAEAELQAALEQAKIAKAGKTNEKGLLEAITIFTFGIGDDVNEEALKKIAEASGGDYLSSADALALCQESMDNYMVWLVK